MLGCISTQLHQHTRCQPFQKFFKRSRVQLRAHFVRVCRGRLFNAAAPPQHAAASSLFPCVRRSLSCVHMSYSAHAMVRERQRSLRGAFLVHLPSAPRVARGTLTHSHHNPRALSSVCSAMRLLSRQPAALQRCRLSPPATRVCRSQRRVTVLQCVAAACVGFARDITPVCSAHE